jgi:radical SAM protein with 4Fe4S-binding SPASM domain
LLRHGKLLSCWKDHKPIPHSLQVALTERCNLNCKFCSVKNRKRTYEWDSHDLVLATEKFMELGTKSVEITGGGEPLLYKDIAKYIEYLHAHGMRIGLITNGLNINYILNMTIRSYIDWIRISSNVYDEVGKIDIPLLFPGTLGFSYVWNEGVSTIETLKKIQDIALYNEVTYIRLVPNCLATKEEQYVNNASLERMAEVLGEPFFFQRKEFGTPKNCYWGYIKPFLYPDGYVYPCSSVVLNSDAGKQFNESYRLCYWSDITKFWEREPRSLVNTDKCDKCVFTDQNEMLEYALCHQDHEEFL